MTMLQDNYLRCSGLWFMASHIEDNVHERLASVTLSKTSKFTGVGQVSKAVRRLSWKSVVIPFSRVL